MLKNITECVEKCPPECHIISFRKFSHYARFPNDKYALALKKRSPLLTNLSLNEIKQSLIRLNINYQSLITTEIGEAPAMSFESLLASLGGHLGLFLGMSLLSFMEIFEILFILVWKYLIFC